MKKLKLNKAKLAFDMLEKEMSVINSPEELEGYLGGQQANDCIIAVFNFYDGPSDSSMMYQNAMMANLNYNTYQSRVPNSSSSSGSSGSSGSAGSTIVAANNGVKPKDIETVGKYGGLTVTSLLNSSNQFVFNINTARTKTGDRIMIRFPSGGSGEYSEHAAIMDSVLPILKNGSVVDGIVSYIDPQRGITDTVLLSRIQGMYGLGGTSSSSSSGN